MTKTHNKMTKYLTKNYMKQKTWKKNLNINEKLYYLNYTKITLVLIIIDISFSK